MGDVTFNPSNNPQTSNAARGDVNSINLRNLGVGNTLVLLNGRRLVSHPVSQAGEGNVPVLGFNSNSLPVAGIERLEMLRDGAAAIYGADAVAGVVNTVTKSDFNGVSIDGRFGFAEGTHRKEYQITGFAGTDFAGGRGNVSLYLDYTQRTAQLSERPRPIPRPTICARSSQTTPRLRRQRQCRQPRRPSRPGPTSRSSAARARSAAARPPSPTRRARSTPSRRSTRAASSRSMPIPASAPARARPARRLRDERFDNAADTTVSPRISRFNSFLSAHYDVSDPSPLYRDRLLPGEEPRDPAADDQPQRDRGAGHQLLESVRPDPSSPTARPIPTASPASPTCPPPACRCA